MKKKFISMLMATIMCFGVVAMAEPEENSEYSEEPSVEFDVPEEEPVVISPNANQYANNVTIEIEMQKHPVVTDSYAEVELYSADGEFLASDKKWVGGITDSVTMNFTVPQYVLGQVFKVKFVGGLRSLQYYDDVYAPGDTFNIQTYGFEGDDGTYIIGNEFHMSGNPFYTKDFVMYNEYGMMSLSPKARLIDGVTYVPLRQIAESLGLDVRYDERYHSVAVSFADKEVAYNIDSPITNYFGVDKEMNGTTRSIEGHVFVPVRSIADAFETGLEVLDFDDHLDVIIGKSQLVQKFYDSLYVNQKKIGSKTNYLIWVSKSEYKVRAYTGQIGTWVPIAEFTCAIGAPDTPTVTGQFDYFSKESRWEYDGYYVGPIMRFYNGYALHSTLLYYGGGEYDGRVGVQISHGCVRLHPEDINWLVDNIPLYTRIWVTD